MENNPRISKSVLDISERSLLGTLEGFFLAVLFFPLLMAYLPIGFKTSAVNFTYGAGGLDPASRPALWQHALWAIGSAYALEAGIRGKLLRAVITVQPWKKAFWMHLGAINIFLLPWAVYYGLKMESMGFFRFFLMENLLQCFWALLFMRTGSILAAGILHGAYNFVRYRIINDVAGPFETLYFYSAASDDFYWLMLAVTFVALAAMLVIIRIWGAREAGEHG